MKILQRVCCLMVSLSLLLVPTVAAAATESETEASTESTVETTATTTSTKAFTGAELAATGDAAKTPQTLRFASKVSVQFLVNDQRKRVELYRIAGQTFGGYDVVQGATSDDKYIYYVLLNKIKNKSKIVKYSPEKNKVVKVSEPLNIYHGNELTYNKHDKKLYVAHCYKSGRTISQVSPKTLKVTKRIKVKVPTFLLGVSKKKLKAVKDFSSISYIPEKKQYLLKIMGSRNYVIANSKFKIVKYVNSSKLISGTTQGTLLLGDRIFQLQSGPNTIGAYTTKGKFKTLHAVDLPNELESIFYYKGSLLGVVYKMKSVEKTKTVEEEVTVVDEDGNKTKKTEKKTVKYKKWYRYNYLVRLSTK